MLKYRKHNLWKAFVDFLFDNDKKMTSSLNIPISRLDGTYLYSPYMGVPPKASVAVCIIKYQSLRAAVFCPLAYYYFRISLHFKKLLKTFFTESWINNDSKDKYIDTYWLTNEKHPCQRCVGRLYNFLFGSLVLQSYNETFQCIYTWKTSRRTLINEQVKF